MHGKSHGRAIALFYFAYLAAFGLLWPYFSIYLGARGVAAWQIGALLSLLPLATLFMPPLMGLLADVGHARIWILRASMALSAIAFAGIERVHSNGWPLWLTVTLFAFFRAPALALVDSAALDFAELHG